MTRAHLDRRPDEVAAMFDRTAERYDLVNDVLSAGQDRLWRRAVARALRPYTSDGKRVLDLAAGTGTSARAFAAAGARCVACDFSLGMLRVGRRRLAGGPAPAGRAPEGGVTFAAGDALALPFGSESFDAVTISFGLRNVADPDAALREMLRVTKPGGRLVICEFSTPTWPPFRKVYFEYLMRALPKVAGVVTRDRGSYDYLAESIVAWPDQLGLARLLKNAGWGEVKCRNLSGGVVALHRATKPSESPAVAPQTTGRPTA